MSVGDVWALVLCASLVFAISLWIVYNVVMARCEFIQYEFKNLKNEMRGCKYTWEDRYWINEKFKVVARLFHKMKGMIDDLKGGQQ